MEDGTKKVLIIGGVVVAIGIGVAVAVAVSKKATAAKKPAAGGGKTGGDTGKSTGAPTTSKSSGTPLTKSQAAATQSSQTPPNNVNTSGQVTTTPSGQPLTSASSTASDKGILIDNLAGGTTNALEIYNTYVGVGGSSAEANPQGYLPWISGDGTNTLWYGSDSTANFEAAQKQLMAAGLIDENGNPV